MLHGNIFQWQTETDKDGVTVKAFKWKIPYSRFVVESALLSTSSYTQRRDAPHRPGPFALNVRVAMVCQNFVEVLFT